MRYLICICVVLMLAGTARASVGYTGGTPCKDSDGWVKVEITDTNGNPWKAAITYECNPYKKTTGSSSNGTGSFSARPPPCNNPVVKFYINHTLQSSQTKNYNNIPNC